MSVHIKSLENVKAVSNNLGEGKNVEEVSGGSEGS